MRVAQSTFLAAATLHAAAAMRMAAIRRPAPMQPTAPAPQAAAAKRPAALQPTATMLATTRRCILAAPVLMPRRANALYDTKTVNAAKNTYDVADATKCKAFLPLLDASGKTLDELASNWDKIATDGDSVRRYLGTVGVTSPLFKIRGGLKGVLKAKDLPDAFDAVAFAEASEQFLAELQDAEGDAYGRPRRRTCLLYAIAATSLALPVICHAGAQFADYSTSVGSGGQSPSATMLGKARKDVERARRSYAELLRLLAPLR